MAANNLTIQQQTLRNSQYIFDDPGMRAVFEDHLPWLLSRANIHQVDAFDAQKYRHDLTAYLHEKQIPLGLHWLYLRLNKMKFNWEFTENTAFLYAPNEDDVNDLINQYALMISK